MTRVVRGIDPSLFFDDDGTVYFTSTGGPGTGIVQTILDIKTGKRLCEPALDLERHRRLLARGAAPLQDRRHLLPDVWPRAAPNTATWSPSPAATTRWGPFESCPFNPILSNRSTPRPIQATGHADLFQAHDGSWWLVFLGIRPRGSYPAFHVPGPRDVPGAGALDRGRLARGRRGRPRGTGSARALGRAALAAARLPRRVRRPDAASLLELFAQSPPGRLFADRPARLDAAGRARRRV